MILPEKPIKDGLYRLDECHREAGHHDAHH